MLKQPTPTVFQADEGDRWMLLGDKPLIFKVDPLSTGSDALVVGTEEMPPGNKIPTHKHLHEDEVIFVHKGAVRVTLAGREYDAGTGATIFIPHGNWIGVANALDSGLVPRAAPIRKRRRGRLFSSPSFTHSDPYRFA